MPLTAFDQHIRKHLSPRSIEACSNWVERFEAWRADNKRSLENDEKLIRDYADFLSGNGKANSTVKTACCWAKKYLCYLADDNGKVLTQKPFDLPKRDYRVSYTPPVEVLDMLINISGSIPVSYGNAIALMPFTGTRDTELISIGYDDWHITKDKRIMLTLRQTKNGKMREVPLLRSGEKIFKNYISMRKELLAGRESKWLFPLQSNPDKPIARKTVEFYMRKLRKEIGLEKLTCHSLRRFYVTNLMRSGVREVDIAKIIGHSDMRTFKLYYQPTAEDLSAALGSL
jgi:site-specific recombinase XerD